MAAGAVAGIAAGYGLSAIGNIVQGQGEASALNYNAQIQQNNATAALISAKLNADKSSLQSNKIIGQAKANYGASGVTSDSGSVLDVIAASSANAELDKQNILYGGQIKAINADNQASLDRISANNALTGSYFGAAGNILKGGATIYGMSSGGGSNNSSGDDGGDS